MQVLDGTSSIKWFVQPVQSAVHWLLPAQKYSPDGQVGPEMQVLDGTSSIWWLVQAVQSAVHRFPLALSHAYGEAVGQAEWATQDEPSE